MRSFSPSTDTIASLTTCRPYSLDIHYRTRAMKITKRIHVPLIENLERMDFQSLDLVMEEKGCKAPVVENNWPDKAPYAPDCTAVVARSLTHLAVVFHVRGLDLLAKAMEDNGPTYKDSCCEMFITDPYDGTYYNFEINCIGTVNAAKRTSRINKTRLDADTLSRIIRHTSTPREVIDQDGLHSWSVAMLIPLDVIGIDPRNVPVSARCNFYKCADDAAHPHYLSWNPIKIAKPDFHRPEYFGEMLFDQ